MWQHKTKRIKRIKSRNRCQECGQQLTGDKGRRFNLHHIVNRQFGGCNKVWNARVRCDTCEALLHKQFPDGNDHSQQYYKQAISTCKKKGCVKCHKGIQ